MTIGKQTSKHRLQVAAYLRNSEGGFTIVESLVAILVAGILLVAIAPVLSLSVATRVQSRRVELATQAAKSYIDAVRTQQVTPPPGPSTATTLPSVSAPTANGNLTCNANSLCTAPSPPTGTNLYCVDFDNSGRCERDSVVDMVVQAFRPNNSTSTQGYALGVRVYRADAFRTSGTLSKNSDSSTQRLTQNTVTAGAGQRTRALVEMTADISDIVPKYNDLCTRIRGINPATDPKDVGCSN